MTVRYAAGSLLNQLRPATTDAVTAFRAESKTEVTVINVANRSASVITFSLYHDDSGNDSYNDDTVLHPEIEIDGNTTISISAPSGAGTGFTVSVNGSIGVQSSVASAINFSLYGVPEDVAPRMLTR